ncbi:MAG TPA: gamma-glutamyl-gamma-aminobutyrate hydrolase family protein [Candidatus Acidoferrum sp.]|nr:gamma-glutamyl-gamma-aminobutyrate hydrolase family protein [Candidatus Acidoferrum sp.]
MKSPLILVTPSTQQNGVEFEDNSISLSNQYSLAVHAGGGLPCIAPCLAEKRFISSAIERCDGVLLTGGDDIQPELYDHDAGSKVRETVTGVDATRDLFELMVIEETFRQHKPLLAICRGHQLVNVAFGGSLVVDIESQLSGAMDHRQMDRKNECVHEVALTRGSLIWKIARNSKLGVNSSHHQAVDRVAEPFEVTARSSDGIIEAMELKPDAAQVLPFFLAVQFHPERLFDRYSGHLGLFKMFVKAAAGSRKL